MDETTQAEIMEWFKDVMTDAESHAAFVTQIDTAAIFEDSVIMEGYNKAHQVMANFVFAPGGWERVAFDKLVCDGYDRGLQQFEIFAGHEKVAGKSDDVRRAFGEWRGYARVMVEFDCDAI